MLDRSKKKKPENWVPVKPITVQSQRVWWWSRSLAGGGGGYGAGKMQNTTGEEDFGSLHGIGLLTPK